MRNDIPYRLSTESSIQANLLSYYDLRLSCLTACDKHEYLEARNIISSMWSDIGQFALDLSRTAGIALSSIIKLLKNPSIVKFFSKIGWSFKQLWNILKKGYDGYRKIIDAIADYISKNSKIMKWTTEECSKLDEFLKKHPIVKTIGGVVLAAVLVYIWFAMSFTGDVGYDIDFSELLDSLSGSYNLTSIFGGADGAKLLILVALGTFEIGFPWPGPSSIQFIISIITTIAEKVGVQIKKFTEDDFEKYSESLQ